MPEKVSISSDLRCYDDNPMYKDWAYTQLRNPSQYEISADYFRKHRGITVVDANEEPGPITIDQYVDLYDVIATKRGGRLVSHNKLRLDSDCFNKNPENLETLVTSGKRSIVTHKNEKNVVAAQNPRFTLIGNDHYNVVVLGIINTFGCQNNNINYCDDRKQVKKTFFSLDPQNDQLQNVHLIDNGNKNNNLKRDSKKINSKQEEIPYNPINNAINVNNFLYDNLSVNKTNKN